MRSPRFGEPARVAFVGQESLHGAFAMHAPVPGVLPRFYDFKPHADDAGELAGALAAWAPHVVVALDPAAPPRTDAPTLALVDGGVAIAPSSRPWRAMPAPVDDRLYAPVRPARRTPRALFVGESTEHRERFLIEAKHGYDLLHYAHGLHGAELADVLSRTDVGVNLREEFGQDGFEHGTLVHLAAGQLLISEPLVPSFGLEPGTDYVEIRRPDELMSALYQLARRPDTYERVRLRGRDKAELFRASVVWPRLVGDLLAQSSSASRGAERLKTP